MPDRLSLMLDSMILAVDEGLSYDGIVSIPERGLEDVSYRHSGLAGLLEDGVEVLRTTAAAISRVVAKFLPKAILPASQPTSSADNRASVADSGISSVEKKSPPPGPRKERPRDTAREYESTQVEPLGPDAGDPVARSEHDSGVPKVSEKPSQKGEDVATPSVDQGPKEDAGSIGQGSRPAPESGDPRKRETAHPGEKASGQPRKKGEDVTDSSFDQGSKEDAGSTGQGNRAAPESGDPRKRETVQPGEKASGQPRKKGEDIAGSSVDQGSKEDEGSTGRSEPRLQDSKDQEPRKRNA
ncbi:hypothetical protein V8E55_003243 [Tylopilus felleus]